MMRRSPTGSPAEAQESEAILEAIRSRRSIGRVKPDRPPREIIGRILDAAVSAPNHYKTSPWRFFVLTGAARQALGDVMAESLRKRLEASKGGDIQVLLEKERAKPMRAPVVIAVAVVPSGEPHVVEIEEVAAGAAAVQNMLLAVDALGLGAKWRTGAPALDPAVKRFLGLPPNAHLLAFVYIGYPDMPDRDAVNVTAEDYTSWLGWDDDGSSQRELPAAE